MKLRLSLVFTLFLSSTALADEPKPWPGASKEAIGGVKAGASAAAVEKAFGKATHKDAAQEEGATGEWVAQWTFKTGESVLMSATKKSGPMTARMVDIKAPSTAKTVEKVGIGSTVADLQKAYGKYLVANPPSYAVGDSLAFTVEHDKVTEIMFGQLSGE